MLLLRGHWGFVCQGPPSSPSLKSQLPQALNHRFCAVSEPTLQTGSLETLGTEGERGTPKITCRTSDNSLTDRLYGELQLSTHSAQVCANDQCQPLFYDLIFDIQYKTMCQSGNNTPQHIKSRYAICFEVCMTINTSFQKRLRINN